MLVANAVVAVLPAVVADAYVVVRADVKQYLLYLNNNKDLFCVRKKYIMETVNFALVALK